MSWRHCSAEVSAVYSGNHSSGDIYMIVSAKEDMLDPRDLKLYIFSP